MTDDELNRYLHQVDLAPVTSEPPNDNARGGAARVTTTPPIGATDESP